VQVAAGCRAVTAVGKKSLRFLEGATADIVDLSVTEASSPKLFADGLHKSHVRSLTLIIPNNSPAGRCSTNQLSDLIGHFKGAHADMRTNRSDQVFSDGPQLTEAHQCLWDNTGNYSAPSGVNSGDAALLRVGDENWHTVCCSHAACQVALGS
jgi:hypothetical protein